MHSERARRRSVDNVKADWVIRICGRAWRGAGPGVALSIMSGATSRRALRRAESGGALARELDAAIAGLEDACLDAALSAAPQDGFRVELRTGCERFIEMFETRDLWTDPARAGAHPGFAALQGAFARMTGLIGDLQQMGGTVAITRIRQSNRMAADDAVAAQAQLDLDRHLARRAEQVVRPLFARPGANPRTARFFEIGVRAGLRAAPAASLRAPGAGRMYYRRGLACGSARRQA